MPGSFCAAKGCSNHSYNTKEKDISFHRFPVQSPALLKQWLVAIKRMDYTPTPYSRLCSLHFEECCFTYQNFTKRRQIKSDAIPTLFCHQSQGHCEGTLSQRLQCLKEKEFAASQSKQENPASCNENDPNWIPCLNSEETSVENSCEPVQLNENLGAAKNLPMADLQANSIIEIEHKCVMEPEIILEESENCTLQYQPEMGVVSKFNSEDLYKCEAKSVAIIVKEQDSKPTPQNSSSIIALSPSRLYLVEKVLGKSGEFIEVGKMPIVLTDQNIM